MYALVCFVLFCFCFFIFDIITLLLLALPIPTRVKDLVSRMTISEKVASLEDDNNGIARLGVPTLKFGEGLHGVVTYCGASYNNNTGCPTSFPNALIMGATFNRTLWKTVGSIISTEGRALNNQGIGALYYWAPNINLFRDPRFFIFVFVFVFLLKKGVR